MMPSMATNKDTSSPDELASKATSTALLWKVGDAASTEKPGPREGHCSCVVGSCLYIFGGVSIGADEDISEKNDLWKFDMEQKKWSKVSSTGSEKPMSRSSATMVSVGTKLYLFGGLSQSVGWLDELFVFDTETNTWTEEEGGVPMPSPRDKLSSAVIGDNIWYFGGFGPQVGGALDLEDEEDSQDSDDEINQLQAEQQSMQFGWFDDLYQYNTQTKAWSQPMQLSMGKPSPRCAATMIAHKDTLVIFGGRDAEGRTNDIHFFNTDTKKWIKDRVIEGTAPDCRSFHAACLIDNNIVVCGGRGTDNQHFDDVHTFNLDTNRWTKLGCTGLSPLGCHTLNAIYSNTVVLYGGSSTFNQTLQHCEKFHSDLLLVDINNTEATTPSIDEGSPKKVKKVE